MTKIVLVGNSNIVLSSLYQRYAFLRVRYPFILKGEVFWFSKAKSCREVHIDSCIIDIFDYSNLVWGFLVIRTHSQRWSLFVYLRRCEHDLILLYRNHYFLRMHILTLLWIAYWFMLIQQNFRSWLHWDEACLLLLLKRTLVTYTLINGRDAANRKIV